MSGRGQAPTAARQGISKIPFTNQLCGPAAETDLLPILLPYTDQGKKDTKTNARDVSASIVRNETIWQYGSGKTTTALLKDDKLQKGAHDAQVLLKYFCHVTKVKLHETEVSDVEITLSELLLSIRSQRLCGQARH